jgi:hypothetical protein
VNTLTRGRAALAVIAAVVVVLAASPGWSDGPLKLETSLKLGVRALDLILDGNLAYLATEKGLTIIDVSDPLHPVRRGSVLALKGNRSYGLAKKGSHIYLAAGRAGMQVIDVSNPDAPTTIGSAYVGGMIWDVAVHPTANAAYAASFRGQVQVFDISNPAAPRLTQRVGALSSRSDSERNLAAMRDLTPQGNAYVTGVSTAGNYVFAGDWNYGALYAWDSTDPLHLTFAGTHRTICLFRSEADLSRGVVYMLITWGRFSGLETIPISLLDPFDATAFDACPECGRQPSGISIDGGGVGFSSNGKYAFYAGGRGRGEVRIVDVRDPTNLRSVAVLPIGLHYTRLGQGMGIVPRGNHLFVAAGLLGLQVYSFPGLSD